MPERSVTLDLGLSLRDAGRTPDGQTASGGQQKPPDPSLVDRFASAMHDPASSDVKSGRAHEAAPVLNPFVLLGSLTRDGVDQEAVALAMHWTSADPARPESAHRVIASSPDADAVTTSLTNTTVANDPLLGESQADAAHLAIGLATTEWGPLRSAALGAGSADTGQDSPHRDARQLLDTVFELADRIMVEIGDQGRRAVRVDLSDSALPGVSLEVYQRGGEWVADFDCSDSASHRVLAEPADSMAAQLADLLRAPARWRVALSDAPEALVEAVSQPSFRAPA